MLEAIPAKTLAFHLTPDSLRSLLLEGMKLEKRGDGLRLTAEMAGGGLDIQVETDPIPALSYTSETSAERNTDSSTHLDVEKQPAAAGILDALKPLIAGGIAILLLVIIILIIRKWQKQ